MFDFMLHIYYGMVAIALGGAIIMTIYDWKASKFR